MKYRTRNEIISQILTSARVLDGTTKTRIMYQAFLSHVQLRDYLSFLIDGGLLEYDSQTNRYRTTEKGVGVLEAYQKINDLVGVAND